MSEIVRPQFHFTPKKNWMNDPNGLVYKDGEYHLFFQHNPFGIEWGHMSWGHAVSKDLLNWDELSVAIPEEGDEAIFSGSAVVDTNNTAGFGAGAIVAIYTSDYTRTPKLEAQSLAFSLDNGRTFTKYASNPVLDLNLEHFRDPKVFWDEYRSRWCMVVVKAHEHLVCIYSSKNLIEWELQSEFGKVAAQGGQWECPDLFEIQTESGSVWVMLVSINPGGPRGTAGTQYFIGTFDGAVFTPTHSTEAPRWIDFGDDNYAGVTYNSEPSNRRIFIGWMSSWQKDKAGTVSAPWKGQMTLPRELTIENGNLMQSPIQELKLKEQRTISFTTNGGAVRILSTLGEIIEIGFNGEEIYCDRSSFSGDSGPTPIQKVPTSQAVVDFLIIIDSGSIETFANRGATVLTNRTPYDSDFTAFETTGNVAALDSANLTQNGA